MIKLTDRDRNAFFVAAELGHYAEAMHCRSARTRQTGLLSSRSRSSFGRFVYSCRGPSGSREKLVILWLMGRLSRANKDICILAEALTHPNLSSSVLSFFLFLWSPLPFHYGEEWNLGCLSPFTWLSVGLVGIGVPFLVTHEDRGCLPRVSGLFSGHPTHFGTI